jgi:hypothetical protein
MHVVLFIFYISHLEVVLDMLDQLLAIVLLSVVLYVCNLKRKCSCFPSHLLNVTYKSLRDLPKEMNYEFTVTVTLNSSQKYRFYVNCRQEM